MTTIFCPFTTQAMLTSAAVASSIGYFAGSIPSGLILSKFFGYGDIRKIGSGNIGATNVLRTGNKKLAALTLALDTLKPILAMSIIYWLSLSGHRNIHIDLDPISNLDIYLQILPTEIRSPFEHCGEPPVFFKNIVFFTGLGAIIGHCYPVWLKFKGGKGVATTLGVLLAAVPFSGMLTCLTWLISAKAGKISSLAAISAMICAPAYTYALYGLYPALINVLISLLVIWRHRENIKRIRAGTEPKIGDKKKAEEK